jgi:hypothetical protein
MIVVTSLSDGVGNYGAEYNNFGLGAFDFVSRQDVQLDDTNVMFIISNNQSIEEMNNIVSGLNGPPNVGTAVSVELTVKIVDLFDEPLGDVTVDVRELGMEANTDAEGWARFVVPQGRWTLVASKDGITSEKAIEPLSNYVTLQRLDVAEIDGLITNLWQFALFVVLVMLGSFLLLFFLHRKVLVGAR